MPLQLLSIFISIFTLHPFPFSSALDAKPGCPDRCGNLSIRYPFGVGPNCFLDPSFNVSCDTKTYPPRAFLTILGKEVVEINPIFVRVKYPYLLSSTCYDVSNDRDRINGSGDHEPFQRSTAIDLSGTQYTVSRRNWITAIGCDDMVMVFEQRGDQRLVGGSCGTICAATTDGNGVGFCPDNGNSSMFGNGCCRAPISEGNDNYIRVYLLQELTYFKLI